MHGASSKAVPLKFVCVLRDVHAESKERYSVGLVHFMWRGNASAPTTGLIIQLLWVRSVLLRGQRTLPYLLWTILCASSATAAVSLAANAEEKISTFSTSRSWACARQF